MRTGRKLWKIMIAALLVVPLFAGGLSAFAVEDETNTAQGANVTLHKRVFEDGMPEDTVNTGLEDNDFGGDPLAGAGFTVYDVTTEYHSAIAGKTQQEAIDAVIAAYNANPAGYTAFRSEQLTVSPNGTTVFADLPLLSGGKDAAYLFVETSVPATPNIVQRAAPFILAMPIYTAAGANGVLNKNIHIYPKNVTAEDTKILDNADSFTTAVIGGVTYPNVAIGDILNYKLTINVPADVGDFTSFIVRDTPGVGMALAATPNIVVAGLTAGAGNDYTITITGTVLELTFDTAKLAAKAGQTLTITYDMVLTADALPDTPIQNSAMTIKVDGEHKVETGITPPPGVVTGGKQFIKKDAHTGTGLAGATFKVTNGTDWAKFTINAKGEYAFAGWGTKDDATLVTAAANGAFKVIGFLAGNYSLEEISAPDGYVLLADEVDFTVAVPGYSTTELDVNNVPKGLLPSTGGSGIYSFLILGAMMMAGAYIWFKRSKEQAEI